MPLLIKFLLIFFVAFFGFSSKALAQSLANSYITIVNPVRISSYTLDPSLSLATQYQEIKKRDLSATWLLTYDAISNDSVLRTVSLMDDKQEIGIFLEVTENFTSDSGVSYNKTDGWHRATSLFLSGYSKDDRRKLIDRVFKEFNKKFGYYPKSVGAWWTDSFSLSYMKDKYGITSVLGISDQYDLDGYQVWGSPWSIPFYPSKLHGGIPAGNTSNKLDIVTFRWAGRDPLNGYLSPSEKEASLYSIQDYHTIGQTNEYLSKLIELYSIKKDYNEFAELTIGLEADYSPQTYLTQFSKRLDIIKEFQERGVSIISMKDFSDWYRKEFPEVSPQHVVETDDLLGQRKRVVWIQGSSYRIGLYYNFETKKINIMDLRAYQENFQEPFFSSPNKQYNQSINLPYVIDSKIDKNSAWEIELGEPQSITREPSGINLNFEKGSIVFRENMIIFPNSISVPTRIKDSKLASIKVSGKDVSFIPNKKFYVSEEGQTIKDFSINIPYAFKIRTERYSLPFTVLGFSILVLLIKMRKRIIKNGRLIIKVIAILVIFYFFVKANNNYYISQTEIDGLSVLSKLPKGRVLVYDKDCLRCKFSTSHKPAAAAGIKSYVTRMGGQEVISDYSFVTAKDSKKARQIISEKSIDYIYLAKYESYIESLPYLPQDLDLEKFYENGNVEIWKVK